MTAEAIRGLLSAAAVRERAHEMLELALEGRVEGWRVEISRLGEAAERTAAVTRQRYPNLILPFHSRWRHLLLPEIEVPDEVDFASVAREAFDLVIV